MVQVTFPDGKQETFDKDEVAVEEIVGSLGDTWRRKAVAARFDGRVVDLHENVSGEGEFCVVTEADEEGLLTLRHTSSHILAHAVQDLFPGTKFAIGPAIEEGFYYDFDVEKPFTPEDLERIERRMNEILKSKPEIHREVWPKEKARKYFSDQNQPYKVELIDEIEDDTVSVYFVGEFTDRENGNRKNQDRQRPPVWTKFYLAQLKTFLPDKINNYGHYQ